MEEVVGREGVAGVELAHVGSEEEGARDGDAHHFVRVDGDGVGEVAPRELVGVRGREDGRSAVRGVDVEPDVVGSADGSEGGNGVVGAQDGGAGRGVQVEGGAAFFFGGGD